MTFFKSLKKLKSWGGDGLGPGGVLPVPVGVLAHTCLEFWSVHSCDSPKNSLLLTPEYQWGMLSQRMWCNEWVKLYHED